jgi:hypothetical protein
MALTPTEPIRQHIMWLQMPISRIADLVGLPHSTVRSLLRRKRTDTVIAAKIMALKRDGDHEPDIIAGNRVSCACGYLSQRFGTLGMAKAHQRLHRTGDR